jgi:hypothetical protein
MLRVRCEHAGINCSGHGRGSSDVKQDSEKVGEVGDQVVD